MHCISRVNFFLALLPVKHCSHMPARSTNMMLYRSTLCHWFSVAPASFFKSIVLQLFFPSLASSLPLSSPLVSCVSCTSPSFLFWLLVSSLPPFSCSLLPPSFPLSISLSLPLSCLSIRLEVRHLLALVAFLTRSQKGCMITSPVSWARTMTSPKRRNTSEPSDSLPSFSTLKTLCWMGDGIWCDVMSRMYSTWFRFRSDSNQVKWNEIKLISLPIHLSACLLPVHYTS